MFNVSRHYNVDRRLVAVLTLLYYGIEVAPDAPFDTFAEILDEGPHSRTAGAIGSSQRAQAMIEKVFSEVEDWDSAVHLATARLLAQFGGTDGLEARSEAAEQATSRIRAGMIEKVRTVNAQQRSGEGRVADVQPEQPDEAKEASGGIPDEVKEVLNHLGIDAEKVQVVNLSELMARRNGTEG